MADLPIEPDYGRNIDPIEDSPDEPQDDTPLEGDVVENDDGSATVQLPSASNPKDQEFYANLAETIEERTLKSIASELLELIEKDKEARKRRDEQYAEGIRRTGLGDEAPGGASFQGASDVVHPVLAEACIDLASRTIKELFPAGGPVKSAIVGDATQEKLEKAERKQKFLNWQLTKQCPEYRSELEQLLSQLGLGGSQYMKVWWENSRPTFEFVPIDDLYLPFFATSMRASQRRTHAQKITRYEFDRRVKAGIYREVESDQDPHLPMSTASEEASNKVEGVEADYYNDDGLRTIFEIQVVYQLDDDSEADGEYRSYIINIDEPSEKVLSIRRNWDSEDDDHESLHWMVEFPFIPWRGAYSIGFPHLIGSLAAAATGSLRALLDSAHINNAATLAKLKGGRASGQDITVEIGQIREMEAPPGVDDIRKVMMAMPFNPPSPVLFQLLGFAVDAAKGVVNTAEETLNQASSTTPVGTTMAMVEAGSHVYSAVHARLHRAQAEVLEIICRLNGQNLSDQETVEELDELLVSRSDFDNNNDIIPVSDPNIFSETQRYAQLQAVLQMASQDAQNPNIPWDQIAIRRRALQLLRVPEANELLKAPPPATRLDPVEENFKAAKGEPLKVYDDQDDVAHMQAHLTFASVPMFTLCSPAIVPTLLGHTKEHLLHYYRKHARAAAKASEALRIAQGDRGQSGSSQLVYQTMMSELQPVLQIMQQVQQQLQQMQQAQQQNVPLDPQSKVAMQLGQAEIQRKTQFDQATLQMKNQEAQLKQAITQSDLARQAQQDQFAQMKNDQEQKLKEMLGQLQAQVQLMKNEQDNKQHASTEIMKNSQDNQTQIIIEQMKQEVAKYTTELSAQTQQVDQKYNDAMSGLMDRLDALSQPQDTSGIEETIRNLADSVSRLSSPVPKQIIRDSSGQPQFVQHGDKLHRIVYDDSGNVIGTEPAA